MAAAACLRAAHAGEDSEEADAGWMLTAKFMLLVSRFLEKT